MDIHDYLGVLRRGIVLIVVGVLIGLAGGFVAQTMEKPSYSATSRELLTNKVAGDLSISQGRIASYVLVASSGLVLQPVIDDLELDTTVDDLARRISVVAPPNTVVIEITATAATPQEAVDIANSVSDHFADVVADQLETTTGVTPTGAPTPTPGPDGTLVTPKPSPSTTKLPNGTVVPVTKPTAPVRVVNLEQAALPPAPNASTGPLMLLVGGVLGLALGLLAASLREAVDRRVRSPRDVARVTEVPVVGSIVADRRLRSELTARAGARTPSAESFRALRAHLDHLRTRDGRRVWVVTAADRRQGASTVAANLAIAIANTGTSVAIVDADLRRPTLSGLFEVDGRRGLSDVLSGKTPLDAVLRATGTPHLTVLPSGPVAANAGELLATSRMRAVLAELAERYDVVLLDTTTISAASDAAVLGALAGSTLLVVQQGAVTRPRLDDALALLEAGGSEPAGIVLTRTRRMVAGRTPVAPVRAAGPSGARPAIEPAEERREASRLEAAAAPAPAPVSPSPAPELPALPASPAPAVGVPETPAAAKPPAPKVVLTRSPSHLATPLPVRGSAAPRSAEPRTSRRVTAPATSAAPVASTQDARVASTQDVSPAPARTSRRVTRPVTSAGSPVAGTGVKVEKPAADAPVPAPAPNDSASADSARRATTAAAVKPASATKPAAVSAAPKKPVAPAPVEAPAESAPAKPAAKPPLDTTGDLVTEVEHTIGTARELDSAFAALPTATAAEQRAGALAADLDSSKPKMVERPIVIKPDARPVSRFAPDPSKLTGRLTGAYASAPAPTPGTQNRVPEVKGTVVDTVSIRVERDVIESATVPPPIRHILPRPGSTIPPKAVEAARPAPEPEPVLVEVKPRTGPVPVPPLARETFAEETRAVPIVAQPVDGIDELDDDPTAETAAIPIVGSLLGEIGGLPRVEVRAARTAAVTDTAPNPERDARESYEQRARQLERVAHERLMREQQRLAVDIREQLAHDKRELESVLDNRLEDTVLRPRDLELD